MEGIYGLVFVAVVYMLQSVLYSLLHNLDVLIDSTYNGFNGATAPIPQPPHHSGDDDDDSSDDDDDDDDDVDAPLYYVQFPDDDDNAPFYHVQFPDDDNDSNEEEHSPPTSFTINTDSLDAPWSSSETVSSSDDDGYAPYLQLLSDDEASNGSSDAPFYHVQFPDDDNDSNEEEQSPPTSNTINPDSLDAPWSSSETVSSDDVIQIAPNNLRDEDSETVIQIAPNNRRDEDSPAEDAPAPPSFLRRVFNSLFSCCVKTSSS